MEAYISQSFTILHMVYIYVQELATTPNKKTTIGFKIPLFQMPSQYHSNVMPQLASPEVAEFFPPNKVLNWEAAKLLGFAGPSDPRLAAAAKANSNNKSLEFLEHLRTVERCRKSLSHDFPTSVL